MDSLIAIAKYLLIVELLGALFFPLAACYFRGAAGRGLGFARPFAILAAGYLCWLAVSLHCATFSIFTVRIVTALVCAALPVLACAALIKSRAVRTPAERRSPDGENGQLSTARGLREIFREALWCELIFLCSFGLFFAAMWLSLAAPYGERALDLALFTSLARATEFPPPDIWLAGAQLNYYYFGHYLGVYLARLAGISELQGYCLFWALLPALIASAAFSLARMLLPGGRRAALWGPVFVLLTGNFSIIRDYFVHGRFFPRTYFYNMTRVIPDTINENPLTAILIGEAHANTIALPFYLLLIGATYHWFRARPQSSKAALPPAALIGFLYGTLIAINYWDVATCGFFILSALLCPACFGGRGSGARERMRSSAFSAGCFLLIALLAGTFYLPFHWNYGAIGAALEWLGNRSTTRPLDLLIHPGLVLIVPLSLLLLQPLYDQKAYPSGFARAALMIAVPLLGVLTAIGLLPAAYGANLLLLYFLLLAAAALWRARRAPPPQRFVLLLIWIALCILWGCEILNVRGPVPGEDFRQNTVFRFYLPAIVFFAVASAAIARRAAVRRRAAQRPRSRPLPLQWPARLGPPLLAAGVLISLIQPVMGTIGRGLRNWRATRLDAALHLAFRTPSDYPAIHWLRAHLPPDAVLVEHPGAAPYGAARYSMAAGLATILGDPHKLQTRGAEQAELDERAAAIAEIYHSRDWPRIEHILRRYNARYVIYPLSAPEAAADPYRAESIAGRRVDRAYYYNREQNPYDPHNRQLYLRHARKIWSRYNLEIFQLNF